MIRQVQAQTRSISFADSILIFFTYIIGSNDPNITLMVEIASSIHTAQMYIVPDREKKNVNNKKKNYVYI